MTNWTKENTAAVGKIPSGLFIVTSSKDDQIDGFLASWIQQMSFEPLLLSIAIKPGRPCFDFITESGHLTINVIGKSGSGLLKHFWSGYDPNNNPFDELAHQPANQAGVILDGAMAAIECQVREVLEPGDHNILVAEVTHCHSLQEDENMIHVRKSGLDY